MSAVATAEAADGAAPAKGGGKKKIIMLAVPVLLAGIGAGLWFGGILPPLLGMGGHGDAAEEAPEPPAAGGHGAPAAGGHGTPAAKPGDAKAGDAKPGPKGPAFMELPEIVANLNAGPRRPSYVKLKPRLELTKAEDEPAVRAALPRLMDLFQTYLREMRPEELRGSAGTYRLREELLARANIALAPVRVVDVLFPELLVQ
jgi:flagellar FliL protein